LSGSNATLDAAGAALFMSNKGPGSDDSAAFDQLRDEYYIDFTPADQENTTNYHIKMGPNFAVDSDGVLFASGAKFVGTITASAGLIGGWAIEDDNMGSVPDGLRLYGNTSASPYHISSSEFQVTNTGQITGSSVLFSGGRIANWDIIGDTLSSVNASGKGIVIDADASTPIIEIREDDNNRIQIYHTTDSDWGIIGRSDSTNIFRLGSTNQIAGWNFTNERLSSFSTATQDKFGISIDSDYQLITIHGDSGDGKNNVGANDRDNVVLAIGQTNTAGQYGIKGWNTAGNRVFELSTERTEIAGWTLDNESLIGGEMIIRKDGTIESAGFASDVAGSGFRLTAAQGGFLEVENAKIRGTLATAVFEKESVNAGGGQLYVANSTVLTSSAFATYNCPPTALTDSFSNTAVANVPRILAFSTSKNPPCAAVNLNPLPATSLANPADSIVPSCRIIILPPDNLSFVIVQPAISLPSPPSFTNVSVEPVPAPS
jgi:hypothetical protein